MAASRHKALRYALQEAAQCLPSFVRKITIMRPPEVRIDVQIDVFEHIEDDTDVLVLCIQKCFHGMYRDLRG